MASRYLSLAVVILLIAMEGMAHAGGLPEAHEWTWTRDGARIFNSVIVLGAFAYLIMKYGGPVLRKRSETIADQIKELEEARTSAEASLKEYEKKIREIEGEREKVKSDAMAEGELIRKKILEQAEKDAEKILERASEQISVETEKARAMLKRQTAKAAIDMAEELLKNRITPNDQKRFVENYIASMEERN